MVMPEGMTGIELARKLRLEKPALPVICTSGYLSDKASLALMHADAMEYLAKPFSLPELARVVRQSLDADAGSPRA